MWIVRLALRRPYSVVVLAVLMLLFGTMATIKMRKDIFPTIDIPVVIVVWSYPGLSAQDMERRVVLLSERAFSTTVSGISRIESQSIIGIGVIKVYFEQGTEIGSAVAQISSVASSITRSLPPGMTPPSVIQYNASNVPVAQLTLSSATLPEQQIFDHALNFIRVLLFTIPGLATPAPYGGKQRQVMIDIDPDAVAARGKSPQDVVDAVLTSNLISPAGTMRVGSTEYDVMMNNSPQKIEQLADVPLTMRDGAVVRLGDVAKVHDGFAVQQSIVRVDGRRASYLSILKKAGASTLAVVDAARDALPSIKAAAPDGLELRIDFDQSGFVRGAISGVLREGVISAVLVSLMVLVFLGSWRSVIIVSTSIPLSIAMGLIGLFALGQTINMMTLGGLSLAIGMLVDDATVEIENINRNRHLDERTSITRAILDAASQIAIPALAATSTICVVFFPVVLLTGPAKYLFTALALSVVISMMASYLLSRTLVPALSDRLLPAEPLEPEGDGWWPRFNRARDRGFDRLRDRYGRVLDLVLAHRVFAIACAALIAAVGVGLAFVVGTDFFPRVDAGQMRLHVRAPLGTRIEDTEHLISAVEREIRQIVPADEIEIIDDTIGVPQSYNLAFVQTDNIGGQDADVLVALKAEHHETAGYERRLRDALPHAFPGTVFYFQPADIITQVLDFGLPAPIDVEVEGPKFEALIPIARKLRDEIRKIPGAVDVHIAQALDHPALQVDVDRERAAEVGLTQRDVANSMLVSLSSSSLVAPSFWLSPETFVNYSVVVQTPLHRETSVNALLATPISPGGGSGAGAFAAPGDGSGSPVPSQLADSPFAPQPGVARQLGDIAKVTPAQDPALVSHDMVQRVLEVRLSVDGRDLGSVASDIDDVIHELGDLGKTIKIHVRGQSDSMRTSFASLELGILLAAFLVYLLLIVLFQSFLDPLVIIVAVPGALVGVMLMLAITGTTLNVESLMGAIMSIGVATSNSILLVSFANEVREADDSIDALEAARQAGRTRLRPVLMTALAMVLGMLPMAFGLGEGGEQNAPLARAVIGGLSVATATTLLLVPAAYTLLRQGPPRKPALDRKVADAEAEGRAGGDGEDHDDQEAT
ncbi:MAG TPA: efflux RND transporter permease subunit [Kofleriaceae bacterium]|nr:efflux RND transporter permease subunit [Kofleriaceae bacterium]